MITTIIFDLADVYIQGVKGFEKPLVPILNRKEEDIFLQIRQGGEPDRLFRGEIKEDDFWKVLIEKNDWDVDVAKLKEVTRHGFTEIRGTREIIEEVRRKGYKLGLLSVHAREWIDYCEKKFDYHKLFDVVSYSFETGIGKPDKEAYKAILNKLKANPEESVFIDDQEKFLKPASELGMKIIQFLDAGQLKRDLNSIGVNL